MNKHYSHLKKTDRFEIALFLEKGYSIRDIAKMLSRSPSTISYEIKKNSTKGKYDPLKADHKAYVKRKYSKYQGMKVVGDDKLREYVESKLKEGWSPEQISGRLKNIDKDIRYAGIKAIYKFVDGPHGKNFKRYLRYQGKKRSKNTNSSKKKLNDRTFIDERPKSVNRRRFFGDWEGDFIVSGKQGKGVSLVLVERKARYYLIKKIDKPTLEAVSNTLVEMTKHLKNINSLTIDNDILFRRHKEFARLLKTSIYFCLPYCSWQKGSVENANMLIREYLPKRCNISSYIQKYIKNIQFKLNNRPRKCLNYKTPLEIMKENSQFEAKLKKDKYKLILTKQKQAECST